MDPLLSPDHVGDGLVDLVLCSVLRIVLGVPRECVHIEDVDKPVWITRAGLPRCPTGIALIDIAPAEDKQFIFLQMAGMVVSMDSALALVDLQELERRQRQDVCIREGLGVVRADAAVDDDTVR